MKQKNIFVFLAVSIIMWAAIVVQSQRATAQSMTDAVWQEKVDGWVMQTAVDNQQTEFLVVLAAQADISPAADLSSKEEKGQFVYETLSQLAAETQAPIIAELEAMGVEYRAYWVNNMIWVRGDASVVQAMAARNDVARIDGNKPSRMDEPIQESSSILSPTATEWGTNRINAPAVWALGYDGTGIVVGGQDTGYRYTHETIANQYRGNGGSHDYNWHDSIHTTGSSCGADSPFPCDDHGHGTHTMGTMVGDDGGSNQVGVAPGAQWIGCRNMNAGVGTPATYSECFQWFIAPTQIDGSNPDPAMAPHVINNSWGCPDSEGCAWNSLQTVVSNTRAAGIIVVVSAGNAGSSCNTVNDPPAIYDDSYSVGSVTSTDAISSFSSRGPADDTGLPKPDISAPGSSIRSGSNSSDSSYMTISGTSMAGPHVVGAVALLLSRAPSLIGDQTAVENLLNTTADPQTTTQICGGVPGSSVPNNTFGWGIVNALTAVNNAPSDFNINTSPTSQSICIPNNTTFDITLGALGNITDTVTLSASGHPAGSTASFSVNSSVPTYTSTLTISNTAGVMAGTYPIAIVGTTGLLTYTSTVSLTLSPPAPISPTLTTPLNNSVDITISPTFTWTAVSNATTYAIEMATDAGFTQIVDSASGLTGVSYQTAVSLDRDTKYYWRVRAMNECGTSEETAVFNFTTTKTAESNNIYLPIIIKPVPNIASQITVTTIDLPATLEGSAGSWCTWGGCTIGPRLYHAPLLNGDSLIGWTDADGNGHVSLVSANGNQEWSFANTTIRGLVGHDDGRFAILRWDVNADTIWLSQHQANGNEEWKTNLNSDIARAEFWLGDGRLEYGNGQYAAYFTVKGISGGFTGHYGDQLIYVNDAGVVQTDGWNWGCSHSMAQLVTYHPDLDAFAAVCSADCFPDKSIHWVNASHQIYQGDGNCGGLVSTQLGQMAVADQAWKLVFNAQEQPCCDGNGIALATLDSNHQTSYVWLTNTDGQYERDPAIARMGANTNSGHYLVGWTTTNDNVFWLGIINDDGQFLKGPDNVSTTGVRWGNRDESFRTRADGTISWVQADASANQIRLFHFDGSPFLP